jgi:hypothetical protein
VTDLGLGDGLDAKVKALFASGEKGVMFDLTRAANLYTDSARTTLVTASGDGVGSCTDLSPNGKHGSSIGSARPTWNSAGYATFDAFDDYLQTAAIDFSATDAVTVVASVRKGSDASIAAAVELGGGDAQAFSAFAPRSTANKGFAFRSRGDAAGASVASSGSLPAPVATVLAGEADISADVVRLRIDGTQVASSPDDQGAGNYSNDVLNIGARNASSLFFNGRIYRLLVIGRTLTTTERNAAERWAAQPAGITIP